MLHVSTQKLIVTLCDLTARGDVQWREAKDGAAVFETEGYAVEVAGDPPRLRVLNSDGNELERVEAESLIAAPWADGEGSFADHVAEMARQAKRLARGTDHAISRILSSLTAPATRAANAPVAATEPSGAAESPDAGGSESEASMAAAVADMEFRLDQAPLEIEAALGRSAPVESPEPALPEEAIAAAAPSPETAPSEAHEPVRPAMTSAEHFKRSPEMFGRTRSFAIAGRTHHRPSPEARPVSSLGKITASGLLMTGAPAMNHPAVELEPTEAQPEPAAPAPLSAEPTPRATLRPLPAPTSPDAYKPWV